MNLSSLETPSLILDKKKLENNIAGFLRLMDRNGVALRPHGKTAKNSKIIRMCLNRESAGITVSTLKEAEYFFSKGIRDIVYAVGIAPVKLDHAANLIKRGALITVILDSIEQANAVITKAREHGVAMPVLIEIDSDGHRSGVAPEDPLLIEIGRLLHTADGVVLQGVLTHAGASYTGRGAEQIRVYARAERDAAVKSAEALRNNGLPCPVVSIGSTPTATHADDFKGITEVRAGVFMFYDLVMAGLGVCDITDIAISVLASVIGHQKSRGQVIIDAGWMALSCDRGTSSQVIDQGYGLVCDIEGEPFLDLIVLSATQEHGIIQARPGAKLEADRFPIGSFVRILPNHACATAAMYDRYMVTDGSTEVVGTWDRINGW